MLCLCNIGRKKEQKNFSPITSHDSTVALPVILSTLARSVHDGLSSPEYWVIEAEISVAKQPSAQCRG